MVDVHLKHNPVLVEYWLILRRFKWMISGLVVVSVLTTGIINKFFTPPLYEAKATLLPAREEAFGGMSVGGSGKEKGGGSGGMIMEALGGKSGGPTLLDTLNVILGSRLMAEAVVEDLNLRQYYGVDSKAAAIRALRGGVTFKTTQYKAIEVTVESKDPKMAADIANAYLSNLDRLNKEYALTSTKRNRLFIEQRLAEKSKRLAEAEDALKEFQTEHRILAVAEVAEGAMGAAADLHASIVELEVQLAALREYATPDHPLINQLQVQIKELRSQLDKMEQFQAQEFGSKRTRAPMSKKLYPAFEESPTLALDLLRLTRRVKVEEAVYGMLVGMLEQAKIAEMKDLPTIQILDVAIPPEMKSKPKTLQNVLVAGALSLVLGIFLALSIPYWEQFRSQVDSVISQAGNTREFLSGEGNGNGSREEVYSIPPKEIQQFHGGSKGET